MGCKMYFWTLCCEAQCLDPVEFKWEDIRVLKLIVKKEKESYVKTIVEDCPKRNRSAVLLAFIGGRHIVEEKIDVRKVEYEEEDNDVLAIRVYVDI